jgi:putative ABC transport system permease protein
MRILFKENLRISVDSIRSHILRTVLTVLIIAFGIMALVGILTSIDAIKFYLQENFTRMGANTFTIRNRSMVVHFGGRSERPRNYKAISFDEAMEFRERFTFPAITSVYAWATGIATVKYGSEKTNPNIGVMGCDENYLSTSGNELSEGRNFNQHELEFGSNVVILGSDIKNDLFGSKADAEGKVVTIGPAKYRVIGVIASKGSSMGFSGDRNCLLPLNNIRKNYPYPNRSYSINVRAAGVETLEPAIGEATGLFRVIRKIEPGKEENFEVTKSDNIAEMLIDNIRTVTLAATIIGLITLLGAAIGLMNIMLVSVAERTREIGIRKAMGATKGMIKQQFLTEAIVIGQIGGGVGILLGIAAGNSISLMISSHFIVPWAWIMSGVLLCLVVALISGAYPAIKAANLDPIEALRYE